MVLDLKLPGMSGFSTDEGRQGASRAAAPADVVYTGRELTRDEEIELQRLAETVIVKDVRSPERLLEETALFLHRVESKLPPPKRAMLRKALAERPVDRGQEGARRRR